MANEMVWCGRWKGPNVVTEELSIVTVKKTLVIEEWIIFFIPFEYRGNATFKLLYIGYSIIFIFNAY